MCRDKFLNSHKFKHKVALVLQRGRSKSLHFTAPRANRDLSLLMPKRRGKERIKRHKSHGREWNEGWRLGDSGSTLISYTHKFWELFLPSDDVMLDKFSKRKYFTLRVCSDAITLTNMFVSHVGTCAGCMLRMGIPNTCCCAIVSILGFSLKHWGL